MSMLMIEVGGQMSRSQRLKQILPQFRHFRTVTPVWIHRWLQNDAHSLKLLRRGALMFLLLFVIHQITRSHGPKHRRQLEISGLQLQFEFTDGYEMMRKSWSGMEELPYCFRGHASNFKVTRAENRFGSQLRLQGRSQASNPSDLCGRI